MKKNKVLALCLSPDQGGLELYIIKLLNYYHEKGQNIPVACSKDSYISKNINSPKIECLSRGFLKKISTFFLIRRFIIDNNINIIYVSWASDLLLSLALKILILGDIKIVYYRQMKIPRPKKHFYHRFIYNKIDSVIVITEKLKNEARRYLPIENNKIHKLTYGIRIPPENTLINKLEFFSKHNMNPKTFSIGLFSRIEEQKGQHLVLNSIIKSKNKIQLFMIGHTMDTRYRDMLEKIANDNKLSSKLKFLDFVKSPMSYMPCFDLIILPTYEETFGLIVAEAMLMKVPVIGSNAGGVPEIIKDNHNGLLFKTKNENDLLKKIDFMIENKKARDIFVANAYNFSRQQYDYNNHFNGLEKIIDLI
tara:strand:- start:7636 stop:8727 length:1092 start_codon:yes stop_codon:yes gene_type:complete